VEALGPPLLGVGCARERPIMPTAATPILSLSPSESDRAVLDTLVRELAARRREGMCFVDAWRPCVLIALDQARPKFERDAWEAALGSHAVKVQWAKAWRREDGPRWPDQLAA
jgi:hypothetical protein